MFPLVWRLWVWVITSVRQTRPELRRLDSQANTGEETQITPFPQVLSSALSLITSSDRHFALANSVWVSGIQMLPSTLPPSPSVPTSKANSHLFHCVASGGPWKSQVMLKTTAQTGSTLSNVGRAPAFFLSHYNKNDNKHWLIHLSGVKIFFFHCKKSIFLSKKCLIGNFSCSKGNRLRGIAMKVGNFLAPVNVWQPVWCASTLEMLYRQVVS